MFLPGPNPFIPTDLEVLGEVDMTQVSNKCLAATRASLIQSDLQSPQRPNLLKDTPASRLWHKTDGRFGVPRANVLIALKRCVLHVSGTRPYKADHSLRSPLSSSTGRNSTMADLLCELFRDSIDEELFDIEIAGLQFSLDFADDAIVVKAMGFNDRLPIVIKSMLTALRNFKSKPERFDEIKDKVRYRSSRNSNSHSPHTFQQLYRGWISTQFEEPHSLAAYYAEYIQAEKMYTPAGKVKELAGK